MSVTKCCNIIGCLITGFIYVLIGCFRSKLSDLSCPITNICNRTGQINFNYLAYPIQSKSRKISYVSRLTGADWKQTWKNWFNDFYSDMFSLDFDCLFSTVINIVISNQAGTTRSVDLKSLAQLLPELYSTQSYYHYLFVSNYYLSK